MSEVNIGNIIVNEEVEITPVKIDIEKIYPETEDLEITPKFEEQTFNHPNTYGYDNVVVKPVVMTEIDITPSNEVQSYTGIFNKVTVETDTNLVPENIKKDVSIFGVAGTGEMLDLEINDCSYLFYKQARISIKDEILSLCKNVTNTNNMFTYCTNLTDLDLSNFDTSNVIDMSYMFNYCSELTNLTINNFDTSNVKDMSYMFAVCNKLNNLDLSNFDTSNVTNMTYMFNRCNAIQNLNLSNFNTSEVTNMSYMFYNCVELESIDISSFDTSKVSNTGSMFYNSSKLKKVIINNQNVFKMTNSNMFMGTPIQTGTGYIYVPDNLVETYKSATNWSIYANQIKPLSELEA